MKHSIIPALAALTAISFTARGLAQGTIYVGNLHTPWTEGGIGDIHGVFRGGTPYGPYTAHFTTGSGTYSLNAITLEFEFDSGYPEGVSAPEQLAVQLFRQTANGNVLLGNLGNPIANPTPTQWPESSNPNAYTTFLDFTPDRGMNLNPLAEYSVVLSMPAGSSVDAAVVFAKSSIFTSRDGWALRETTSGNPYESGEYLVMAVNATLVPEPDTADLLSSSLIILLGWKVSRRLRTFQV